MLVEPVCCLLAFVSPVGSSNCFPCSDEDITEDGETVVRSEEGGASVATSSAQTLIETANPVFGRVKRLWNSSLGTHREASEVSMIRVVVMTSHGVCVCVCYRCVQY